MRLHLSCLPRAMARGKPSIASACASTTRKRASAARRVPRKSMKSGFTEERSSWTLAEAARRPVPLADCGPGHPIRRVPTLHV